MTKPKVKFLMTVWGKRYIAMSGAIALPSLLAPGNFPALAAATDLEVVIMTAADDVGVIRRNPAFQRLATLCPMSFIAIDDLIIPVPPLFGVTLTQAFSRGLMRAGSEQTETHFIFMNADFVLADGSLRSLAARIVAGDPCVVAPSFRADAEAVDPLLRAAVDPDSHVLAMAPRKMAALALANLHPTSIGKTLTQERLRSRSFNQLYWSADASTMIGHAHLIFMLCIKPERPLTRVASYCDYAFIPELVPSGRMICLDDSDDFFMLELQGPIPDHEALEPGAITRDAVLRQLAEWTTPTHRRMAQFSLVFHGGELPFGIDSIKRMANEYVQGLHADLPPPRDYLRHPHWMGALEVWRTLYDRRQGRDPPRLPESNFATASFRSRLVRWARPALRPLVRLTRRSPVAPIWRLEVSEAGCAQRWLAALAHSPAINALVVSDGGILHRFFERQRSVVTSSAETLLLKPIRAQCTGPFDRIYVRLTHANRWQAPLLAVELLPRLAPNGMFELFFDQPDGETGVAAELVRFTETLLPNGGSGYRHTVEAIESPPLHGLGWRAWDTAATMLMSRRWAFPWRRLLIAPTWLVSAALMAWHRPPAGAPTAGCIIRFESTVERRVAEARVVDAFPS